MKRTRNKYNKKYKPFMKNYKNGRPWTYYMERKLTQPVVQL